VSVVEISSRGRPEAPEARGRGRAPAWALAGGVVLALSLVVDVFLFLSSAATLAIGPNNQVETAFYLFTLFVLLPAAVVVAGHLAGVLRSAGGTAAVSGVAARAATALLCVLLVSRLARLAAIPSSALLLPFSAAWGLGLLLAVRAVHRRGWPSARLGASDTDRMWTLAAGLAAVCVLAFLSPEVLDPLKLGISVAIAGVLTAVHLLWPALGIRRRLWPIDAIALGLVVLTVTDLSGYLEYLRADAVTVVLADGLRLTPEFLGFAHRIHSDFWLGPLNDMLHGRALLVDVSSQYGVGPLYFLAVFFSEAPLGYGPLALLVGLLSALQYALVYGVMRLGGCARTLAIPAIAAAAVGLLLGSIGSPADFPSTGGLRFGIPWLVVLLAVLWTRCPRGRRILRGAATGLVGVSSIWSFETFVYTGAAFAAVAAFEAAALGPGHRRVRALSRDLLMAASCCAVAHLLLAVGTRAFAGDWPDWSTYLALLRFYAVGSELFGVVVDPWSPGLPLFLLLLGSGVSIAALLSRRAELVLERRPALVGIAAASGLGVVSFSYFVGNSHPNTLMYPALPALVAGSLWASLLGAAGLETRRALRTLAVTAGFWVAALLAISGWPDATEKWPRTALAHAIPGAGHGGSIPEAVARLWRSPPSDSRAPAAEALLARRLPPRAPALVILEPELTIETLVRSRRVNVLPIGHPEQESLVPRQADPPVLRATDRLPAGTLMLTQPGQFDPPVEPRGAAPHLRKGRLARIQRVALRRIRAKFRLETLERGPSGLAIVRLRRRGPRPDVGRAVPPHLSSPGVPNRGRH